MQCLYRIPDRQLVQTIVRRANKEFRVASCVQMLMEPQYAGSTSFDQIASELNLSPSRLRHLFRQYVGISPSRFIKLLRIQHAYELLSRSHLTVKQVMSRIGVSDFSHFVRDYQRIVGERPSITRKNRARVSA